MKIQVEMTEEQREWIHGRIVDWFEWVDSDVRDTDDKTINDLTMQLHQAKEIGGE